MAEVGLPGAGGNDQAVVGKLEKLAIGAHHRHLPALQIEGAHLGQLYLDVLVTMQDPAQRRGDLSLRENARRHLVQQRLEEMVIDAVNQGDLNRRAAQVSGRE